MATAMVNETVSKIFRDAFESHPARRSDPALALDSARETASEAVPAGVTGRFDDALLTFTADAREETKMATTYDAAKYRALDSDTSEPLALNPTSELIAASLESEQAEGHVRAVIVQREGEDMLDVAPTWQPSGDTIRCYVVER